MRVRNGRLAAEGVQDGCVICGIGLAVRMSDRLGATEGSTHPGPRHIRVAERPQCPADVSHTRDTGVPTDRPSRQAFGFVAHIELGDTALEHPPRFNGVSHQQQRRSASTHRVDRGRPIAGRFGEPERNRGCVQRFGQLAAEDMHGHHPIHDLRILRCITEPLTKLAGVRGGCRIGVRVRSLGGHQAGPQRELEVELKPVLGCAVWQTAESLDAAAQMGDRLEIGVARDGDFGGAHPITRRLFGQPRLGQMMCQGLRLGRDEVREGPLDGAGNGGVKLNATALQQPGIGGIAYKGMLETVPFARQPASDDQLGMPQCLQGGTEGVLGHARGGGEKVVVEITPDASRDLRHILDRRQAIEARRERIM